MASLPSETRAQQEAWPSRLVSRQDIAVSQTRARMWFLGLAEHPDRYQFASHRGFVFTRGRFGEAGAQFRTEELFRGVRLALQFELVHVSTDQFTFALRKPASAIFGRFSLSPLNQRCTRLELAVGSPRRSGCLLLRFPIIRGAIQQQIDRETRHIKESMEQSDQEETWAS